MDLLVRTAEPRDKNDLTEISRNTWDGHDYLEKAAETWFNDSGFMVGEISGRVVACGKITELPGKVAWLEGLRVHPDFRGKGFGRIMSERVLQEAVRLRENGRFHHIEFSTYISNMESRSMAEKQGFRIAEFFHVIGLENPSTDLLRVSVTPAELASKDLSIYEMHVPCGWKYPLASAGNTLEWLTENAEFWQTDGGARFLTSRRGFEISPLASSLGNPLEFLRGALSLVLSREMDYSEMMIHDSHSALLEIALEYGYEYWEEPGQANIPVYSYFS